jgi:hypothetical protein
MNPFPFLNEHRQVIGFALIALWACWAYLPNVTTLYTRLRSLFPAMPGVAPPVADDEAADFAALSRLRKRFERNNCKDGQAAVDVCLSHFFHKDG